MKAIGFAVVVSLQYSIPVYLLGSPSLAMAFTKDRVLAKVFADEVDDREAMGKGTKHVAVGSLYLWCVLFASLGLDPSRNLEPLPFQLQLRNEIRIGIVIQVTGVASHILLLQIILQIVLRIACCLILLSR